MYVQRKDLYKELEQNRQSKVLVYVTGDRPGLETDVHSEVLDYFVNHLDIFGVTKKITLYLYTRGGNTLAGWSIVNLIRQFCDEFEVIVPAKCHSTGTLMCLGAHSIVMTKQATLGPIDPSINGPLNPGIEGAPPQARFPVSVEAIKGYIELAKGELDIKDDANLTQILLKLSEKVHPLVLGQVYRSRSQIQMLAKKLIKTQIQDDKKIENVISFLCSESGSHDYTIHRREAKGDLGLNIDKPDDEQYKTIKSIYDDIQSELKLTKRYDQQAILGGDKEKQYILKRALIESIEGGSNYFCSEGVLRKHTISTASGIDQTGIEDSRSYEGWRFEK